jgi:import receptor subunit TOM20
MDSSTASGMSARTLGLCAAAGLGAAFLGYCVYFDRQRRSAPDFKAKLRERRRRAARTAQQQRGPQLPDFADQEAVQRFFLQEVRLHRFRRHEYYHVTCDI